MIKMKYSIENKGLVFWPKPHEIAKATNKELMVYANRLFFPRIKKKFDIDDL
jgi:phage pi2 protein 07